MPDRLYIAVRGDLSPGLQAAQAVHAAFELQYHHPNVIGEWVRNSNYLVIVSVPNEDALLALTDRADDLKIKFGLIREPDLDNQATAIAFHPSESARRLCSSLPLALKAAVTI